MLQFAVKRESVMLLRPGSLINAVGCLFKLMQSPFEARTLAHSTPQLYGP